MGVFEYLGVIISVIMGLGVTHILGGLSKTIHHRRTINTYWVHSLWAFNVLLYVVTIWWGMFWWSGLENWSYFNFMMLISYAIMLFLAASLIYPWDFEKDVDLEEHFYETRPWFFAVLAFAWFLDVPETLLKTEDGLRDLPQAYLLFAGTQLVLAIAGCLVSNRTFHKAYAVFYPVLTLSYLSLTTLRQIAG